MVYTNDCIKPLWKRANNVQVKTLKTKDGDITEIWFTPRKESPGRAAKVANLQQDPLAEAGKIARLLRPREEMRHEVADAIRKRAKAHADRMVGYTALIKAEPAKLWGRRNAR